jgi:hypothetical protein
MFFRRVKYVITETQDVIVFSETLEHAQFKSFNPISAGFISFGVNKNGNPSCSCYGESISLGMKSDPERDTMLANRKFSMEEYY